MFSDYKVQVVDFYKRNRVLGNLPLNLINPTPAKLKKESLLVFQSRSAKGDIAILRQFFGHRDDDEGYLKAIKNIDTDKFKPLVNYLKEQTQDTEDKNIELLAWLIDYNPRPFQFSFDEKKLPNEEKIEDSIIKRSEYEPIIRLSNKLNLQSKSSFKNYLLKFGFTLLIVLISFFLFNHFRNNKINLNFARNKNQCMYWSNDRFVSINCNEKIEQVQIIALDESKLKYFKKITRSDTINILDIRGIWYSKINNVVELFTTPGNHPVYTEKQLKPLSKYMFDKYVKTGKIGK